MQTTEGRVGGYVLGRDAAELTLLAVEGDAPAFRCAEIRQNGPFGTPPEACVRPCGVAQAMDAAERAWRASLAGVTIADLVATVTARTDAPTQAAMRQWLRP